MRGQITEAETKRPPFVYWTCLWGAGLAVALVALAYDVLARDLGTPVGRDFSNLYAAGKLALAGHPWDAFNIDTFRLALREYVGDLTLQNYSYPPHALLLAVPFALVPYGVALALWTLLGAAFFMWAAKPYCRFSPLLAALTPAAALNMWNGHYGFIVGGLWLLFFRDFHSRPLRAGLAAAALTFKPHMGLLVGLSSLTSWRVLLSAAAGTLALVALSAWLFDPGSWYGFIGETVGAQTEILTRAKNEFYFRLMPSAFTAYGRGTAAMVAQGAFAMTAIAMLARYRKVEPFALATATFVIVPYVFVYDMTVACLGFAILLWRDWAVLRRWERWILSAAFLCPTTTMMVKYIGPWVAPPILLAALWVQTREA